MYILFDPVRSRQDLLPLTYIRPVADCRVGIMTIREKWEHLLGSSTYTLSESYLEAKYPFCRQAGSHYYINGSVLPNQNLLDQIHGLEEEQSLIEGFNVIALRSAKLQLNFENLEAIALSAKQIQYAGSLKKLNYPYDIFRLNGSEIKSDFGLLTKGRISQPLSPTNRVVGDASLIFLEKGAEVECSIINTKGGPVYIGAQAEVMENCTIRGPFSLNTHATLKMSAKIYGDTTVGPYCKIGGEVSNSVFFAYSNKGHDGFVGNSVVAEWCNLGADTNTSNLKNNYGNVDVWNYREKKAVSTDLQFHGLIMADHSKSGINTMFNTGAVVGVAANIFGGGFPDKFIPSFSWGGAEVMETFRFEKALEASARMMERRQIELTSADRQILQVVFDRDARFRK